MELFSLASICLSLFNPPHPKSTLSRRKLEIVAILYTLCCSFRAVFERGAEAELNVAEIIKATLWLMVAEIRKVFTSTVCLQPGRLRRPQTSEQGCVMVGFKHANYMRLHLDLQTRSHRLSFV